jgi:hypothetical protein
MWSTLFVRQLIVVTGFLLLSLAACVWSEKETVVPATRRPVEVTASPAAIFTPTAAVPTIAATESIPVAAATATPPATAAPQATEVPPKPWLVVPPTTAAPLPVREEVTFNVAAQLEGTAEAAGYTRVDKIALNQDVAYIFAGEALHVLDRTQLAAPTVAGPPLPLSPGTGIMELYVRENRLYVVGVDNPMLVLDISQPASPRLVTEAGVRPGAGNWPVPALAGNALYMPAGDTLQINGISDPANPVLVNTITPAAGTFFQSASVSDRYLIASGPDSTTNAVRLQLYDVGDPFQPVEVGQFQLPDPCLLVTTMANDTLYIVTSDISQGNHYLYTLDLSNPAQPAAGGGFALPFGVQEMVAAGDTLYAIGSSRSDMPEPPGGVWALDVSDPSQPYLAGQRELLTNASPDVHGCRLCDLSVDGDWLYVAAGDSGLFVLQAVK